MADFYLRQTVDLNGRYGGPVGSYEDVKRLHLLIGGQPFLTRRALDTLATGRMNFAPLLAQAACDDGPFADYLTHILISVSRLSPVVEYAREMLTGPARRTRARSTAC